MSDSRREIAEIKARPMCEDGKTPGMIVAHGTILLAENASHYLYLDAPGLVVQGITDLVHEARAKNTDGN